MGILKDFIENSKLKKEVKYAVNAKNQDIERFKAYLKKETDDLEKLQEIKNTGHIDEEHFKGWNKGYLNDLINDNDTLEQAISNKKSQAIRWEESLKSAKAELKFIRPQLELDTQERFKIMKNFASETLGADSDNKLDLRFHATTIMATEEIIKSGGLFAVRDRLGENAITTNEHNQISVGKIDEIQYSVNYWMNANPKFGNCLPCGCMFVLSPDDNEKDMIETRQMHNVDFRKEPDKLFAIVCTTENLDRVKEWMNEQNLDSNKVVSFEKFPEVVREAVIQQEISRPLQEEPER